MIPTPTILVTGATGYIGGRIVPRLLEAGYKTRCLVRDPSRLEGRPWFSKIEISKGDVLEPETLESAMRGIDVAFYFVHSMASGEDFRKRDQEAAYNFAEAARRFGVKRIIYLGGLGDSNSLLSEHLRSRQETGDVLRESGIPVTEFRSGVIVGSGSLSFEIVRALTERLPFLICPRWVYRRIQPIAIRNVLDYLLAALVTEESIGRIIEIGGADVLTYADMFKIYAKVRGLHRLLVPVPFLTTKLSSHWIHWITPVPSAIARPLIEGLHNDVVVADQTARKLFPNIELLTYEEAVRLALVRLAKGPIETAWTDALASSQGDLKPVILAFQEGMIVERRQIYVSAAAEKVYQVFSGLGGNCGWLYMNCAWRLRGIIDRLLGGVGMRRGRRDPIKLRVGDALDFWRVEAVTPGKTLRLRAEMKLPGQAWLEFQANPVSKNMTLLTQNAFFAPKGLGGLAYWYGLYPAHALIFSGLIKKIGEKALEKTEN